MVASHKDLLRAFLEQMSWMYAQDPNAVLLPNRLHQVQDVADLIKEEKLHVLAIKMKDVNVRPCIGFKSRASYGVVVDTPYCVSQKSMESVFKPVVMLIDEAARIMEPLLWPPLAWYTELHNVNLLAVIQVGDHFQTRPLVTSLPKDQVPYQQLRMSMMTRLDLSESALDKLVEQYRMHLDIANLVSRVFYYDTLVNNPCIYHENDPLTAYMRQFNFRIFGRERDLLALELKRHEANVEIQSQVCIKSCPRFGMKSQQDRFCHGDED